MEIQYQIKNSCIVEVGSILQLLVPCLLWEEGQKIGKEEQLSLFRRCHPVKPENEYHRMYGLNIYFICLYNNLM